MISGRDSGRLDGGRRPLRVPAKDLVHQTGSDQRGPFLLLTFSLPAGAYATSLLREVTKQD